MKKLLSATVVSLIMANGTWAAGVEKKKEKANKEKLHNCIDWNLAREAYTDRLQGINKATNINGRDQSGITALMIAADSGSLKFIEQFLSKGVETHLGQKVDINATDNDGRNALVYAIYPRGSKKFKIEIIKLLLEHGADYLIEIPDSETPLDSIKGLAKYYPEFKDLLEWMVKKKMITAQEAGFSQAPGGPVTE